MIIPSIDLMDGSAVQLVGGREKVLDAGDPRPLLDQFSLIGEVAIIDLDAALSQGSNEELILSLLKNARCRVGGGIRNLEKAKFWLDAGAEKIILGTKAEVELLKELPRERLIAALDANRGEVVVEGWRKGTGRKIIERIEELKDYVSGFLVTFVEHEGRLGGTALEQVAEIVEAAKPARVTFAGGISTTEEIAKLHELGADSQVGMAIYTKKLSLTDAFLAPMEKTASSEGLWPSVVVDEAGIALGLSWSNRASVAQALENKQGVYFSRSRQELWVKGKTSGNTQELLRIDFDCDADALRFTVRQQGSGFCHLESRTCWGEDWGLRRLFRRLQKRLTDAPPGSYTKRLLEDKELLNTKILEEARELTEISSQDEVVWESSDLIYFILVKLMSENAQLDDVERSLEKRALKVTRRPGDRKGAPN